MFRSIDEAGGASKTSAISQNNESIQKRLLSKRELSTGLGVSTRTIDTWLAQKRIPQLRLSARLTRFNLSRVEVALSRYEIREVGGAGR
jgi:predicted DNA-binding transcriptional regulator AlpA